MDGRHLPAPAIPPQQGHSLHSPSPGVRYPAGFSQNRLRWKCAGWCHPRQSPSLAFWPLAPSFGGMGGWLAGGTAGLSPQSRLLPQHQDPAESIHADVVFLPIFHAQSKPVRFFPSGKQNIAGGVGASSQRVRVSGGTPGSGWGSGHCIWGSCPSIGAGSKTVTKTDVHWKLSFFRKQFSLGSTLRKPWRSLWKHPAVLQHLELKFSITNSEIVFHRAGIFD